MIGLARDSYLRPTKHELAMAEVHEAICAGDRQLALDLLGKLYPQYQFRSVAEQRNLFPDRVPA